MFEYWSTSEEFWVFAVLSIVVIFLASIFTGYSPVRTPVRSGLIIALVLCLVWVVLDLMRIGFDINHAGYPVNVMEVSIADLDLPNHGAVCLLKDLPEGLKAVVSGDQGQSSHNARSEFFSVMLPTAGLAVAFWLVYMISFGFISRPRLT